MFLDTYKQNLGNDNSFKCLTLVFKDFTVNVWTFFPLSVAGNRLKLFIESAD